MRFLYVLLIAIMASCEGYGASLSQGTAEGEEERKASDGVIESYIHTLSSHIESLRQSLPLPYRSRKPVFDSAQNYLKTDGNIRNFTNHINEENFSNLVEVYTKCINLQFSVKNIQQLITNLESYKRAMRRVIDVRQAEHAAVASTTGASAEQVRRLEQRNEELERRIEVFEADDTHEIIAQQADNIRDLLSTLRAKMPSVQQKVQLEGVIGQLQEEVRRQESFIEDIAKPSWQVTLQLPYNINNAMDTIALQHTLVDNCRTALRIFTLKSKAVGIASSMSEALTDIKQTVESAAYEVRIYGAWQGIAEDLEWFKTEKRLSNDQKAQEEAGKVYTAIKQGEEKLYVADAGDAGLSWIGGKLKPAVQKKQDGTFSVLKGNPLHQVYKHVAQNGDIYQLKEALLTLRTAYIALVSAFSSNATSIVNSILKASDEEMDAYLSEGMTSFASFYEDITPDVSAMMEDAAGLMQNGIGIVVIARATNKYIAEIKPLQDLLDNRLYSERKYNDIITYRVELINEYLARRAAYAQKVIGRVKEQESIAVYLESYGSEWVKATKSMVTSVYDDFSVPSGDAVKDPLYQSAVRVSGYMGMKKELIRVRQKALRIQEPHTHDGKAITFDTVYLPKNGAPFPEDSEILQLCQDLLRKGYSDQGLVAAIEALYEQIQQQKQAGALNYIMQMKRLMGQYVESLQKVRESIEANADIGALIRGDRDNTHHRSLHSLFYTLFLRGGAYDFIAAVSKGVDGRVWAYQHAFDQIFMRAEERLLNVYKQAAEAAKKAVDDGDAAVATVADLDPPEGLKNKAFAEFEKMSDANKRVYKAKYEAVMAEKKKTECLPHAFLKIVGDARDKFFEIKAIVDMRKAYPSYIFTGGHALGPFAVVMDPRAVAWDLT